MFTQTFVDGTQKTQKPITVVLSVLLEVLVIGVLILIPLFYTHVLPSAQLRNLLLAPQPSVTALPRPPAFRAQSRPSTRTLNSRILIAPRIIPTKVNPVNDIAPAPDIAAPSAPTGEGGAIDNIIHSADTASPPPAPPSKPSPSKPVRMSTGATEANLIRKVMPVYPPVAKSARIQGTVEFTAIISKEGNIENLQLVRGHPLLVNAAREAVLQWKYRPTLLNGQPVEVVTDIIVNFTLAQ